MDKIARLVNFGLPVSVCNMRCPYCYVGQVGWNTNDIGHLDYSPEHIQRCLTKERLGGVCHISLCGSGETLLAPYTVDLAKRMLENGHYVSVVTNGTVTKRIEELCNLPLTYRERLFFKFSLHYLELQRLDLMDVFFQNVQRAHDSEISYSMELTSSDECVPHIQEVIRRCEKEGTALPHVIELRKQSDADGYARLTQIPLETHQKIYAEFDSSLFRFQQELWGKKRCEFCYAGDWIVQLDGKSGWTVPCFIGGKPLQNIYENPDEPIRFAAIGNNCPWDHCYSAYVLLTSGAIPELGVPTYAAMRDRVDANGRHWLTPKVAEFFSSKFSETNREYSEGKKEYINALMALEYQNRSRPYQPEKVGKVVSDALAVRGIKTVGIWGVSLYTDWLADLLMGTRIRIRYIVDAEMPPKTAKEKKEGILRRFFPTSGWPALLSGSEQLPEVDAMIVADYPHFNRLREDIPPVYGQLLSLTELADETIS